VPAGCENDTLVADDFLRAAINSQFESILAIPSPDRRSFPSPYRRRRCFYVPYFGTKANVKPSIMPLRVYLVDLDDNAGVRSREHEHVTCVRHDRTGSTSSH
jgi:hypothetical protein